MACCGRCGSEAGQALCIDPLLCRLLVRSLVNLARLTACAGRPLGCGRRPRVEHRQDCLGAVVVPLGFRDRALARRVVFEARGLRGAGGCAGSNSGPALGSDSGLWKRPKLLRRTREVVKAAEALGTRLAQYKLNCVSLAMYRAQFCAPDPFLFEAHRQAVQRLCAAPWVAFSIDLMQGLRGLGFSAEVPDMRALATSARLGASSESGLSQRCIDELKSVAGSHESLLDHSLRFWEEESVLASPVGRMRCSSFLSA